jgi:hypothetical protein
MKIEEYIKKGVKLEGYGPLSAVKLDAKFFRTVEAAIGTIDRVLEIIKGMGGLGGCLSEGEIEGCVIISKKGSIYCIESDGEYVDLFIAEDNEERETPSALRESIREFVEIVKERGLIEEGMKKE